MSQHRLIAIDLDDASILRRGADIERERSVAMYDLLEHNSFAPCRSVAQGHDGPYRLQLSVREGRLTMAIAREDAAPLETVILGLGGFQRTIRDYFAICESYFKAIKSKGSAAIEPIDMARRALHNDGAELLRECLQGRIEMDFPTARRLFTLICVLHIK